MITSTPLQTRVPPETKDALVLLAGEHDRSVSGEVRHALDVWVRAHGAGVVREPETRARGETSEAPGAVELVAAARIEEPT